MSLSKIYREKVDSLKRLYITKRERKFMHTGETLPQVMVNNYNIDEFIKHIKLDVVEGVIGSIMLNLTMRIEEIESYLEESEESKMELEILNRLVKYVNSEKHN